MNTNQVVARLFDEFVEAHVSGRRPDVREYLQRARPAEADLGLLIDRFLSLASIEEPDEETILRLNARLEHVTPLTAARTRLALKVDELVERLREALGLSEVLRGRLRTAYQELEAEQLNPAGVHERVWEALQMILGLDPRRLTTRETVSFAAGPYLRTADWEALEDLGSLADLHASAPARLSRKGPVPDEVDALFRGSGLQ